MTTRPLTLHCKVNTARRAKVNGEVRAAGAFSGKVDAGFPSENAANQEEAGRGWTFCNPPLVPAEICCKAESHLGFS
jgi:hypothetical protein